DCRSDRIARHVPGERPRRNAGEKHAEQKDDVVDGQRRKTGGIEREAEERDAEEVLRERERVARRIEDVGVEEVERVAKGLVVVPMQDPGGQLRVPEVR